MTKDSFVTIDSDWPEARKAIRKASPEIAKAMNKAIRTEAKKIQAEARRGFAEYSTRIGRAVGVSVSAKRVSLKLSGKKAPHGPINEFGGRHPVFGNRSVWVTQEARPRLKPAVDRNRPKVRAAIEAEVRKAGKRAGVLIEK